MPWVEFTADHDHTVPERRAVTYAYRAGMQRNVTRACAQEAIAAGRARRIKAPATRAAAQALAGTAG